ncbi:MAG: nickel pincer cofactor biosynthesis protein LarC [Phycisphaerae bacterium]|jgi:hypothetical protein|nr:nickel pincer cofactor biosynthesis protein LarC [Phycisphaerae bacterium]MCZ2400736.1 nickel pincer cofactor biosynthesis protein LarC [Phycisphaerae bacterium]
MRCAYFDCFSGAAGDMILAALLDAGCPLEHLQQVVARLNVPDVALAAEKVNVHGLAATRVRVEIGEGARTAHRHLSHILKIIDAAGLEPGVAERAAGVFRRLAEAEAAVHATTVEKVHFHEVGANDAIVDIVCAAAALHHLGVERVFCSEVPTGHGSVTCDHGTMPVPAPATARLLIGVPLADCPEPGELITPTGAAILTSVSEAYGPIPGGFRAAAVGYGAGTRPGKTRPNVLRVLLGDLADESAEHDQVVVLEAQVDDATGQTLAYACQRLLDAAALDAWLTPILMKKGRPGHLLSVLARPQDADRLEALLLAETTTFGVRRYSATRRKLAREHIEVTTAFGPIRMKVGRRGGRVVRAWPEYEDCAAAARRAGAALQDVQQAALAAWRQRSSA